MLFNIFSLHAENNGNYRAARKCVAVNVSKGSPVFFRLLLSQFQLARVDLINDPPLINRTSIIFNNLRRTRWHVSNKFFFKVPVFPVIGNITEAITSKLMLGKRGLLGEFISNAPLPTLKVIKGSLIRITFH